MKSILIKENRNPIYGLDFFSRCGAVFSFSFERADFFPENYLSHIDEQTIYDEVYFKWMNFLKNREKTTFIYKDVDLLWSIKVDLFYYLFQAALKYRLLNEILRKHPSSEIYILEQEDTTFPFLSQIVEATPLANSQKIKIIRSANKQRGPFKKTSYFQTFLSKFFMRAPLSREPRIAFFSDYEKCKTILFRLRKKALFYSQDLAPRIFLRSLTEGFSFYQGCYSQKKESSRFEEPKYLNFSSFKLEPFDIENLLAPKLSHFFKKQLPKLLSAIDQMERFFQKQKQIKFALLDEDTSPTHNAYCQLAKKYNIKTYVECHGALGHKIGFLPLTSDYIFTWGSEQKHKLIEWGCEPEKILISGASRYTTYKKIFSEIARKKIIKDLSLPKSKKIFLVAFMPIRFRRNIFEHEIQNIIIETISAIKECPQYEFILKIHPGDDNIENFKKWTHPCPHIRMIEKYDPLLLARGVDALIVYNSTYAVDGFALEKPIICIHDKMTSILSEFRKYRVFHYATGKSELLKAIQIVSENNWEKSETPTEARLALLNENGKAPEDIILSYIFKNNHPQMKI